MRWAVWRAAGVVIAAGLAVSACGKTKADAEDVAIPATILKRTDVVIADSSRVESGPIISGTLQPKNVARLRAQVGGRVLDVRAEVGQSVAQGALLVSLDQADRQDAVLSARTLVRSAEVARDLAKRNLERSEKLVAAGAVSDQSLEQSKSALEQAQAAFDDANARLRNAQEQLDYTRVRAPFSGIVTEQAAKPGDVVQAGDNLITVVVPSPLELAATVPVEQYAAAKKGASVTFAVAALKGRSFAGRVNRVNPSVDPDTRQLMLYVDVPNGDRALVAGLFAEGRLAHVSEVALTIPAAALDERDGSPKVLRVRGGRVERVPVTLGIRDDVAEKIAITKGLARGDTLLVGGALTVSPGTPVRVGTDK